MLNVNLKPNMMITTNQTRKIRRLVLKYKASIAKKQKIKSSLSGLDADIQNGILESVQRKLKSKIIRFFIPYIEKSAYRAFQTEGVNIQDYTQNLYLKFFENLENIVRNEKFHLTELYRPLKNPDYTDEKDIYANECSLDSLTPQEELENSCGQEDITFMQKAQSIITILQRVLTPKEFEIFYMKANGSKYEEIAEEMQENVKRIGWILSKSRKKINESHVRQILDNILFDNENTRDDLARLEKIQTMKSANVPNFNPDEIWQTVDKKRGRLNVSKELDTMLKTQTTCKELLNDVPSQTKMRKKLEKNPDFKLKLKLDRKCCNPTFIRAAGRISIKLFGKNIFEFTE